MELVLKDGWIEVIAGSMYAGKTEELLRRIRRIEYAKKDVIVFKPCIDNRYSNDEVVSHNNSRVKSINISSASEIYKHLEKELPYAIAIDEVIDDGIVLETDAICSEGSTAFDVVISELKKEKIHF